MPNVYLTLSYNEEMFSDEMNMTKLTWLNEPIEEPTSFTDDDFFDRKIRTHLNELCDLHEITNEKSYHDCFSQFLVVLGRCPFFSVKIFRKLTESSSLQSHISPNKNEDKRWLFYRISFAAVSVDNIYLGDILMETQFIWKCNTFEYCLVNSIEIWNI